MPDRSVKMKRRIFGFQRRVWWPKWTPASSSSRMEATGMGRRPGLEPDPEQRVPAEQLLHLEMRHGLARRVGVERMSQRVVAIAADGRVDGPAPGARTAGDEREILAGHRSRLHHLLQAAVRLGGAGDDEQAGRVAVEPVDD